MSYPSWNRGTTIKRKGTKRGKPSDNTLERHIGPPAPPRQRPVRGARQTVTRLLRAAGLPQALVNVGEELIDATGSAFRNAARVYGGPSRSSAQEQKAEANIGTFQRELANFLAFGMSSASSPENLSGFAGALVDFAIDEISNVGQNTVMTGAGAKRVSTIVAGIRDWFRESSVPPGSDVSDQVMHQRPAPPDGEYKAFIDDIDNAHNVEDLSRNAIELNKRSFHVEYGYFNPDAKQNIGRILVPNNLDQNYLYAFNVAGGATNSRVWTNTFGQIVVRHVEVRGDFSRNSDALGTETFIDWIMAFEEEGHTVTQSVVSGNPACRPESGLIAAGKRKLTAIMFDGANYFYSVADINIDKDVCVPLLNGDKIRFQVAPQIGNCSCYIVLKIFAHSVF